MSDRTDEKKYTIVREHIRRIPTRTTNRNKTYCSRCGATPGKKSVCIGTFTIHNFMTGMGKMACSRCGKEVGKRSVCVGTFTLHNFVPT